jgi:hypothetical protein
MSITLSIDVTKGAGGNADVAPRLVHFSAVNTTSSETTRPFDELIYFWDFGDTGSSGSGNWNNWGVMPNFPRNKSKGPVVAHVYEDPGTYTWKCWCKNPVTGTLAYTTGSVTVISADSVFSGSNTVCFSTSGNFTGAPSGATQITTSSGTTVMSHKGSGKRLLLRAGETFTWDSAPTSSGITLMTIGKFGSGANPIINLNASTNLLDPHNSSQLRLIDLNVQGQANSNTNCMGSFYTCSDILVLRVSGGNYATGDNGFVFIDFGTMSDFVGLVDCDMNGLGPGGNGANWVFAYCSRLCILGSSFVDTSSREHVVRLQYTPNSVVAYVRAKDPAPAKGCLTIRGPLWGGGTSFPAGSYQEYINVYGVYTEGSDTGLMGSAPSSDTQDQRIRYEVWDSCLGVVSENINVCSRFALDYFTVRNCAVIIIGSVLTGNCHAFNFDKNAGSVEPDHVGGRFYNNTIAGNTSNNLDCVFLAGAVSDCVVKKCYCQNLGAGTHNVISDSSSPSAPPTQADNIGSGSNNVTTNPPTVFSDLIPANGSSIHNAGGTEKLPVWDDAGGRERPLDNWDVGAWEYGASVLSPSVIGNYYSFTSGSNYYVIAT